MRCSSCGIESPGSKKFCSECGTLLSRSCPLCGADNATTAKFCGECGASLRAPVGAPLSEAPSAQPRDSGGERRHLTVMFCDMVGATEISARLDPEEWREIEADYLRAAAEAITRFGGFVAKYLGDGVLAYFGWPEAHITTPNAPRAPDSRLLRQPSRSIGATGRNAKVTQKSAPQMPSHNDLPFKNSPISRMCFRTREWRNGRRAGLRIQCRKACGFKSRLSHSKQFKGL